MASSIDRATTWGEKAVRLYDVPYAKRYRSHDEALAASEPYQRFVRWLEGICRSFQPPIDVLDLGCGTGRYFSVLTGVRHLVGLDASAAMLAEARHPYKGHCVSATSITLVEGDLLAHAFEPGQFDLVYSIGVLAEHVPLDPRIVSRVSDWLTPHGRFAFSTVHPESSSVPRTTGRRIGNAVASALPGALGRPLRQRLLAEGLYADEQRVRELLTPGFAIESLERVESEAHLHCLCVARKN